MAYIDVDKLHAKLQKGWSLYDDGLNCERLPLERKYQKLRKETKPDLEKISKLENQIKENFAQRRGKSFIEQLKYKYMLTVPIERFKSGDDAKKVFEENKEAGYKECKPNSIVLKKYAH